VPRRFRQGGEPRPTKYFPEVCFAACDWRGRVHGPRMRGTARLLEGEEDCHAASSINRKYPLLQGIAVRYGHKLMRYRTQHYAVEGIEPF
jgi:uncharacterized protein